MPEIIRHGVRICYDVHGEGVPILLSHGYSATRRMWRGQLDAWPGHRVITWDMRGHGESDSPDSADAYSQEHTVADMAAILDAQGIASAVIGGLSLGGYVSLAFHAAHPLRTSALMLFDTGPGYRSDSGREAWNRTAFARAAKLDTEGLAALGGSAEVRMAQHRSAAGLAHAARGMLAQADARAMDVLPRIACPTLVLCGADDKPFLAATDYMAARIPGARKVLLAGAGHAANIDQPAAFNSAVADFLAGIGA